MPLIWIFNTNGIPLRTCRILSQIPYFKSLAKLFSVACHTLTQNTVIPWVQLPSHFEWNVNFEFILSHTSYSTTLRTRFINSLSLMLYLSYMPYSEQQVFIYKFYLIQENIALHYQINRYEGWAITVLP